MTRCNNACVWTCGGAFEQDECIACFGAIDNVLGLGGARCEHVRLDPEVCVLGLHHAVIRNRWNTRFFRRIRDDRSSFTVNRNHNQNFCAPRKRLLGLALLLMASSSPRRN